MTVVLALALIAGPGLPAEASCAGPGLDAPRRVAPGETVTIVGEDFWDGECDDTGPDGGFCSAEPEPARPRVNMPLQFVQGDQSWRLATVDADDSFGFRVQVVVPPDAQPGAGYFAAPGAGAEVRVHRQSGSPDTDRA